MTHLLHRQQKLGLTSHIVAFSHDDYHQYFIAVEQKLYMECADLAMAIFLVLGAHYIFVTRHEKIGLMYT